MGVGNDKNHQVALVGEKELAAIEATLYECAKSISLKKRSEETAEYASIYQQFLQYFNLADAHELSLEGYEDEFSMWVVNLLSQYI